jgi:hypothetical protein
MKLGGKFADQFYDRIPAAQQYASSRRGRSQFLSDDGYRDRYDRVDSYGMQPQSLSYSQRQAYGSRLVEAPAQRTFPGTGRMMDRGGRPLLAQHNRKGPGFAVQQAPRMIAAPMAPEKTGRLPQEAYIKRQSLRWLIKQRLQQVLCESVLLLATCFLT